VVTNPSTGVSEKDLTNKDFTIYPNPANNRLFVTFFDPSMSAYYIRVINAVGKTVQMLPRPQLQNGIDISALSAGVYYLQVTDDLTKSISVKKFVKQ
jgi:hypothetical protein